MGERTSRLATYLYGLGFVGSAAMRFVGDVVPRPVNLIFLILTFGALLFLRGPIGEAPADMLAVLVMVVSLGSFTQTACFLILHLAGFAWFVYYLTKGRKRENYVADRRVVVGFAVATIALFVVDLALAG